MKNSTDSFGELAPVVLFVYNRPGVTLSTLEHLKNNKLADRSVLFIYSDGPKEGANEDALGKIKEVRDIIRREKWCGEVHIIESPDNLGLADSIINGVTEIVNRYGKIIVLEDDLLTSVHFLEYLNDALRRYADYEQVFTILGYNYPLKLKNKENAYFSIVSSCLGWGTWERSWSKFDPSPQDYGKLSYDKKLRYKFDLDGSYPYSRMLKLQMEEDVDSWAVKWWWTIFKNNGLTLFPGTTLIKHIGFDPDATHTKKEIKDFNKYFNEHNNISKFPSEVSVDYSFYKKQKRYIKGIHKKTILMLLKKIIRYFLKKIRKIYLLNI